MCLHAVFGERRVAVFMKTLSVKPVLVVPIAFLDCSSSVCVAEVDTHPPFLLTAARVG